MTDWARVRHAVLVEMACNGQWENVDGPGQLTLRKAWKPGDRMAEGRLLMCFDEAPAGKPDLHPYAPPRDRMVVVWMNPRQHLAGMTWPGPPRSWVSAPRVRAATLTGLELSASPATPGVQDLEDALTRARQGTVSVDLEGKSIHNAISRGLTVLLKHGLVEHAARFHIRVDDGGFKVRFEVEGEWRDVMSSEKPDIGQGYLGVLDDLALQEQVRTRHPDFVLKVERPDPGSVYMVVSG